MDKLAVKTIYKKPDGSKTARWERYEGNTLVKNLNGLQMPLYHVYNLTDNTKPVFIVEGEKDVETMEKLGYVATTSPNGAGSKRNIHLLHQLIASIRYAVLLLMITHITQ